MITYFDTGKDTEICVDASPFGLSAILFQKERNSEDRRVVAYGSRALTQVEQRYSQTEREGLGIVWGIEHFHQYVYGTTFTLITDHKPLETIYGNTSSKPSARIERWVLRLQPYKFTVVYRNGKNNPADYMSRHPPEKAKSSQEHYVHFIAKNDIPKAMTRDEIITETECDNELILLKQVISSNKWEDEQLARFKAIQKEFSGYIKDCWFYNEKYNILTKEEERKNIVLVDDLYEILKLNELKLNKICEEWKDQEFVRKK